MAEWIYRFNSWRADYEGEEDWLPFGTWLNKQLEGGWEINLSWRQPWKSSEEWLTELDQGNRTSFHYQFRYCQTE